MGGIEIAGHRGKKIFRVVVLYYHAVFHDRNYSFDENIQNDAAGLAGFYIVRFIHCIVQIYSLYSNELYEFHR